MQSEPLVSVLMTAYNRELYIGEAIESVLKSTYKNWELIIVDDCSIDNTLKIAKSYAEKDSRIAVYRNDKNLGDYPNRNKAVEYSRGTYIMFVDSDDKTYPFSIDYCVGKMIEDTSVDMGILCRDDSLCNKVLSPPASIQYHFFSKPFLIIGPGGTILKREFFMKIGQYPIKYGAANDMYFNLKAASSGKIKCLCKEFLYYRSHNQQEMNNSYSYLYNNYNFLNDALNNLDLQLTNAQLKWLLKKMKRRFFTNISRYFFSSLNFKKTIYAIKQTPFSLKDAFIGIFHFD